MVKQKHFLCIILALCLSFFFDGTNHDLRLSDAHLNPASTANYAVLLHQTKHSAISLPKTENIIPVLRENAHQNNSLRKTSAKLPFCSFSSAFSFLHVSRITAFVQQNRITRHTSTIISYMHKKDGKK